MRLWYHCLVPESPLVVKMNTELESYFCQAVEHNYERALEALLTNVENPVAVVNKVYTVKVGNMYARTFMQCVWHTWLESFILIN